MGSRSSRGCAEENDRRRDFVQHVGTLFEKGNASTLLIMLLDLLLGFAAFCRTCFDSLVPYCDGLSMRDGGGGHFVNSTFDRMQCAIRPATWQAVLVSVRKNYCQFARWPVRPAPF